MGKGWGAWLGSPVLVHVASMLLEMEAARMPMAVQGALGLLPIPSHQAGAQQVLTGTAPSLAGKLLSGEAGLISLLNLPP